MKQSTTISLKGTSYYSAPDLLSRGALSPGTALSLRHEKNNSHDANAVAIHIRATGAKLGHIPKEYAPKYASLVDQGKIIEAKINSFASGRSRPAIHVTITYDSSVLEEPSERLHIYAVSEVAGVYVIRNSHSAREYIGSSVNVKRRVAEHAKELRLGTHGNRMLQEDYIQFGAGAFSATMLAACANGSQSQMEAVIIAQKLTAGTPLYNVTKDGKGIGFRPIDIGEARSISDKVRPVPPSRTKETSVKSISPPSGCLGVFVAGIFVMLPLFSYALSFFYG